MAVVLVWRPWGLFGRPQARGARRRPRIEPPLRPLPASWRRVGWIAGALLALSRCSTRRRRYAVVLLIDIADRRRCSPPACTS